MSRKTCDAFFCNKSVPAKYRYCYDCAKSKGLIQGETHWLVWLGALLFLILIFG